MAAPQVKPAPKATIATFMPRFNLPVFSASHRRSGIVAAVVLPYFWMLCRSFSCGNPSCSATYWLMRMFAWWNANKSMSLAESCFSQRTCMSDMHMRSTAFLKTGLPSMCGQRSSGGISALPILSPLIIFA